MDIKEIRKDLELLETQCRDFDKLISKEGVYKILMKAQYGVLPPEEFIKICEAFVYISKTSRNLEG